MNRRFQTGTRGLIAAVALSALLFAYVESYRRLSRRGVREAADYGIAGFLYVPCADAAADKNLDRHYALTLFYAPLNAVDRALFGGPAPCVCLMRLSG